MSTVTKAAIRPAWSEAELPLGGSYIVYWDTTSHATEALVKANASSRNVGLAQYALIDNLEYSTTYYVWVQWSSQSRSSALSGPSSISTTDAPLREADGVSIVITSGSATVREEGFTNIKKVAGVTTSALPMGNVANPVELRAISYRTCIDNAGITCYVQSRGRTFHFFPTNTVGFAIPDNADVAITAIADAGSGQVTVTAAGHVFIVGDDVDIEGTTDYDGNYTIDAVSGDTFTITAAFTSSQTGTVTGRGAWSYPAGEDPEHYRPDASTLAEITAIPFSDLEPRMRIYCGEIGTDLFWMHDATQGDHEPDDKPTVNLFDDSSSNILADTFMGANGVATSSSTYFVSDYIEVKAGESYNCESSSNNMRFYTAYDENKNLVSAEGSNSATDSITVPATGVKYYRFTGHNASKSTYQFEKGSTQTSFVSFGQTTGFWTSNKPVAPRYTVSNAPSTATDGHIIIVTDETGGRTLATGDGTNWRRVYDGAVIS